jgi:hypothetical protein
MDRFQLARIFLRRVPGGHPLCTRIPAAGNPSLDRAGGLVLLPARVWPPGARVRGVIPARLMTTLPVFCPVSTYL